MHRDQVKEELVVLQASLTQEDEMKFDSEELWAQWEVRRFSLPLFGAAEADPHPFKPALADAAPPSSSLALPTLSLRLAPDVDLGVEYLDGDELPDLSLHCLTLGRGEQARLRAELERAVQQVQGEGTSTSPSRAS